MKVCYINDDRRRERYRNVPIENMVEDLRSERFADALRKVRALFATGDYDLVVDGESGQQVLSVRGIPNVCFASEMSTRNGVRRTTAYNALVLLEINNLPDKETAEALRDAATSVPFTMLAFVGAEQLSVKIVCRAQASTRELADELLAEVSEQGEKLRRFHANAYHQLRQTYSMQLGVNIDLVEPRLDRTCLMSADAAAYYNAEATPVVADALVHEDISSWNMPLQGVEALDMSMFDFCIARYCHALSQAYTACAGVPAGEWVAAVLNHLARLCRDADLPMEFCLIQVRYNQDLDVDEDIVRTVFNAYYSRKMVKTDRNRLLGTSDLVGMKTERFLLEHYQLRVNVMTGVTQYRRRNLHQVQFKDVTPRALNTMCHRAVDAGLGIWDKDIRRFLDSDRIPEYDPLNDYLDHLPRWDGKDRLTPFLQRVKTDNPCWVNDGKVWLRSMVAHWMGKDSVHGNAIVPVLIGRQGGGKTSFCSMILPPELHDYYNDNISFKNDTDLNLGLTSFGLINIDEFDALSPTKHPLLKYLLSKADVKMRPPYGKAYVQRRRVASFIATTNNPRPLTDVTGSRRFVCIKTDEIDHTSSVNYPQLYAQIKAEIQAGKPYFFREADNQRIMQANAPFLRVTDYPTMITTIFLPPNRCADAPLMFIPQIVQLLIEQFPTFTHSNNAERLLGRVLVSLGYERIHRAQGNGYRIAPKTLVE